MLHLFRKYQKAIFYLVTFVIIVTFIFFGTYQSFSSQGKIKDPVVFKTVGKEKITQSLLTQMTHFLSSEKSPFPSPYALFTTNYLNDGVVSKDFLKCGLETRIPAYEMILAEKFEKEKDYRPYVNPHVRSISAENCWTLFAPDIREKLTKMQRETPSFETKVALFEAEKRFPPVLLAQMLRYQEHEYANMRGDLKLQRGEVSLFGYHNLEDWFGKEYLEECAKVILNGASIARQKGYVVKREEILCNIYARTQNAYEVFRKEIESQIPNAHTFYQYFIRQNGFDEETLVKIMEELFLFERLLSDVSQAPLIDTLAFEKFYAYAHEYAVVEVTQMPRELCFKNLEEWKKFELYLASVAKADGLALPEEMDAIEEIEKRAPQLVGERYELYVAHLPKKALEANVSMRETWEWEEEHLELLKERFPQLKDESLESFDAKKRAKVDAFAREQIVDQNPQWIAEAFKNLDMKEMKLFVTSKMSSQKELPGVEDFATLLREDETVGYTEDGMNYYRILVKARPSEKEVLSLSEATFDENADVLLEEKRALIEEYIGKKVSLEEAMPYRFAYFLEKQKKALFAPIQRELTLSRMEPSFIAFDDLVEGTSPVLVDEKEGAYRYRFVEKKVDRIIPQDKIQKAQALLAQEIRELYLKKLYQ